MRNITDWKLNRAPQPKLAGSNRKRQHLARISIVSIFAVLISTQVAVPANAAINPVCTTDCSSLTVDIVVNGGTATPADWALGATRNGDSYTFTSGVAKDVARNATYALTATGGPSDYTESFSCTVNANVTFNAVAHTVTFPSQSNRSATCTFTFTSSTPASITVHAGGLRTGATTVGAMPNGAVFTATAVSGSPAGGPFTCTTASITGTCDIAVPSGFAWDVSETAVPSGYYTNPSLDYGGSATVTAETYVFRTGTVTSNVDVPGSSANGTYSDIRHAGSNNFSGLLSASLNNPAVSQKCGLNVALVLDQSGSMAGTKQTALKTAANDTVTALTGTPSRVAIYTFASLVGSSVASTSTATTSSAASLHTFINGLGTPSGSTNWDAGLHQVASGFDLVILLTDGAPTTYGNNAGNGSSSYFQYVDHGIFSANTIKAGGATLIGVGIGLSGADENLRAVSGPNLDQDYYLASSTSFGQVLKDLATGNCSNQLTIQKQIQDPTGTLISNSALANGWSFANEISTGSTIDSSSTTAQVNDQNGFASAAVTIPAGATPTVSVTETLQADYTFVGAKCTVDGVEVATSVNGTTASFVGQSSVPMSCLFTNRQDAGHWTLSKTASPSSGTSVSVGDSVTYTLSAHNPGDVVVLGASASDDVSDVLDDATLGTLPSGLTKVGSVLTWAIGNLAAGQTKTISYTATVKSEAYGATLKNVVTPGDSGSCVVAADCTTTHNTPKRATLTLVKAVNNGTTGGTKTSADWTLSAAGGSTGTQIVDSASGLTHTVIPGSYAMSESVQATGYTVDGTWVCTGQDPVTGRPESNVVVIAAGQDVTCTITNMAVMPSLTLNKVVVNGDTGSTHTPSDWALSASGPTAVVGVATGTKTFVASGSYALSESGPSGYSSSAWDCDSTAVVAGVVHVALGQDVVCTVTNTAIASSLTLNKSVINGTTGATHVAADWSLSAAGPSSISSVATGTKSTVKVGHYTLSESGPSGYTASAWDCGTATLVGDVVTVPLGADVSCTVTNTARSSSLTLVKVLDNGQTGATHTLADWTLSASGPTTISSVESGTKTTVKIGDYALSESGPDGYSSTAWDCGDVAVSAGTVAVGLGQDITCTVTNIAKHSSLTLNKVVHNGSTGATFTAADWALSASGPSPISNVTSGTKTTVKIGDYTLSEAGPMGYTSSTWDCGDALVVAGVVSIGLGQDVVCTITNTAVMPTLTLNKIVENGTSGATYTAADWSLSASGPTTIANVASGTKSDAQVGTYSLTESGPSGYSASAWDCGDALVVDGVVTVTLGQSVDCTVTNTAKSSSLTLIKHVDNGTTGATHVASDWSLSASGATSVNNVASGAKTTVKVGNYALSESGPDGYTASLWDCGSATVVSGSVLVGVGQDVTCEITNTAQDASLTLVKTVDNGQTGATATASDWSLSASGPTDVSSVVTGTASTVKVGTYTLSESGPAGYTASAWDCGTVSVSAGSIAIAVGQHVTCTVHNTAQVSSLTLNKVVINGETGSTNVSSDWLLSAAGPTAVSSVTSGTKSTVQVGTYTLSESGPSGYSASTWDCGAAPVVDGVVTVALGQDIRCTVTNTARTSSLTLIKQVDNELTGATHTAADWTLSAAGPTVISSVQSGTKTTVKTGDYALSESGPDGYTASVWDCGSATVVAGVVTVALGEDVTCTVRNVAQHSSLTLNKVVHNGSTGSTVAASAWELSAAGPTTIDSVASGTKTTVKVGDYALAESGPVGYSASTWDCGDALVVAGVVSIGLGQDVVCTITNTAVMPTLTLNKIVENGTSGATYTAADWSLSASGPTTIANVTSGTKSEVQIGHYTLTESGPSGYSASAWDCGTAQVVDGVVTLALGQDVSCTVTNTAQSAALTLVKSVDNGTTGAAYVAGDWALSASGPSQVSDVISGTKSIVKVGTYTLSESGPAGYTASAWDCGDAQRVDGAVIVGVGQDITCTITNTARSSSLTLNKIVVNGETGATHVSTDWSLSASGPTSVSGVLTGTKTTVQVGSYLLSELGASGYSASTWDCGDAQVINGTVMIDLGADVVCTVTNTATTPLLTLRKLVDNGDTASTYVASDWLLSASGPTTLDHVAPGIVSQVKIGDYTLSEAGPDGYTASAWDCGDATVVDGVVSIALGADVTCTVTNTAIAPTLTLDKVVNNGETGATYTAADWSLSASGPTNVSEVASGTKSTVKVGDYTLGESGPDGYTASAWDCGDAQVTGNVVHVGVGQDVSCSVINTAVAPTWTLAKTSNPASGSSVNPGDTIAYTLTLTRTSGVMPASVVVTDDLTNVLSHASMGSISTAWGSASVVGTTLTWAAAAVATSVTLTYEVTVDSDAWGVSLTNVATPPDGGSCIESCQTENFTPHFLISKTSDPGNGAVVEPGQVVTYTLTARNDSQATLTGATATDDMSKVLDNATLTLPLADGLTLEADGVTMTWAIPTLASSETASVSYTVTIDSGTAGLDLSNVVVPGDGGACEIPQGTPSGQVAAQETGCDNSHYINAMDLTIIKKHTVPTGTSAVNGKSTSPITYDLKVTNSGKLAPYDDAPDVVVTDLLEGHLKINVGSIVAPEWDTSATTEGTFSAKYIGNGGVLEPGASSTISFTAVIIRPIDFTEVTIPSLLNEACVATSGVEVSTENNCSQDATPIEAVALDPAATCRNNILTMDYSIPLYGKPASPGSPVTVAMIWWAPGGYRDQDLSIDAMDTAALLANGALRVDYVTTPAGWKQGQLIKGFVYWPGVSLGTDGKVLSYPGRFKTSDGRWVLSPAAPYYSIHEQATVEVRITTSTTRTPVTVNADPTCYPRTGQLAFTGAGGISWHLLSVIFSGLGLVAFLAARRRRILG